MTDLFLQEKHLEILRTIFRQVCPAATIAAFGSRIKSEAHEGSDLDLAVLNWGGHNDCPAKLKNALEESSLPFLIDIVDFNKVPPAFQQEISKKNVIIYPPETPEKDNSQSRLTD